MRKTRLVLSDAAIADVVEQADWYREQSDARKALGESYDVSPVALRDRHRKY